MRFSVGSLVCQRRSLLKVILMIQKSWLMAAALIGVSCAMSGQVEAQTLGYGAPCSNCQTGYSSIPGYNTYMNMTLLAPTNYPGYPSYSGYGGCGYGGCGLFSRCRLFNHGGGYWGGVSSCGYQTCGYGSYGPVGYAGYGSYGSGCGGCGYGGDGGCGYGGLGCGRRWLGFTGGSRTFSCCYRGNNCLTAGGQGWVYPGAMSGGYGYAPTGICGCQTSMACCQSSMNYGCLPSCCSPVSNCCVTDPAMSAPGTTTPGATTPGSTTPNAPTPLQTTPAPAPAPQVPAPPAEPSA